jgi:hypothetical protein
VACVAALPMTGFCLRGHPWFVRPASHTFTAFRVEFSFVGFFWMLFSCVSSILAHTIKNITAKLWLQHNMRSCMNSQATLRGRCGKWQALMVGPALCHLCVISNPSTVTAPTRTPGTSAWAADYLGTCYNLATNQPPARLAQQSRGRQACTPDTQAAGAAKGPAAAAIRGPLVPPPPPEPAFSYSLTPSHLENTS